MTKPEKWEVAATIASQLFEMSMQLELLMFAAERFETLPVAMPKLDALYEIINSNGEAWHKYSSELMPDNFVRDILVGDKEKELLRAHGLTIQDGDIVKVDQDGDR